MLVKVPFDLAAVVRGCRAMLKLGQADVAREAGVGRQWLGKFESGEGAVELGMALKVVTALGLEVRLFAPRDLSPYPNIRVLRSPEPHMGALDEREVRDAVAKRLQL